MMKGLKILTLLLLAVAFSTVPLHADTLTFTPLNQTVNLGNQATVSIVFDTPLVGDFDMLVNWNPAILSLANFSFGTKLGDPNDPLQTITGTSSNGGFEVSFLSAAQLAALQGNGPITLFTMTFNTLSVGTSSLIFAPPAGSTFIPIGDENGIQRKFTAQQGSITVVAGGGPAPVPEPGTLLLLSTGLVGLAAFRRRKSS